MISFVAIGFFVIPFVSIRKARTTAPTRREPMLDRRTFLIQGALAGAGALASGWTAPLRAAAPPRWAPYEDAMVIDGCGFIGNADSQPGEALDSTLLGEARASGLRVLQTTVGPVAQYED